MELDYYKILELPKTATESDIKKSYRRLARKYHPDLSPDDKEAEKKFKQINEANEVLSNPESRKKYDKYGKEWKHADEFEKQGYGSSQQQHYTKQNQSSGPAGDFSDFFQSMYAGANGGRTRETKFKGQDFNAELHLTLKDVFKTHKKTLTVNNKNIRITIPAGLQDGQIIKIAGHGASGGNGGTNGDLYITFSIANNTDFKRDGNNLYTTAVLELYTAMLGGELFVNTFDGKVKVKIPPETQGGTQIKLKGKGFPIYKMEEHFGDLYITYTIKTPTGLTEKEKELFKELAALRTNA